MSVDPVRLERWVAIEEQRVGALAFDADRDHRTSGLGKSISQMRADLSNKSRDEFETLFTVLLSEVMDGTARSKRLGQLDRVGIDAYAITSEEDLSISTAIQCKGFESRDYDNEQHAQCRREIAKFKAKGPKVPEYWFVINRPIKERLKREELEKDLSELIRCGKVGKTELLDIEPLVRRLRDLAIARLAVWSEAKRSELFEYYSTRLGFVDYIRNVPFNGKRPQYGPVAHILNRAQEFFRDLNDSQTGKNRLAPTVLVTSGFGFGKTSTLHALSRRWTELGGHLIYAPAALLDDAAFSNGTGLAKALLNLVIPEDAEISDLGHHVFRDALRDTLTRSRNWLLLIDGLDENPAAFNPNRLAALWGSIRDLGVPAILSVRDELVNIRTSEFFPDAGLKVAPVFERINLEDWPDDLILEFVRGYLVARGNDEPLGFRTFREIVESKRYSGVYGDIPKRPLFLGMLAEDAWSGNEPERQLHRLYGKYLRKKFLLDRRSIAASGASTRPSAIVEELGIDEAAERLVLVMQEAANEMFAILGGEQGRLAGRVQDTIGERRLREIAIQHGISSLQLEDVVSHSLLQPAGKDQRTRERLLRFAHRSFQDWFLARWYAEHGGASLELLPDSVAKFLSAMREDLAAGGSLP
jgi:hypothetical protein